MSSAAITTLIKMMESLPVDVQEKVVDHLRDYIDDLQDEIHYLSSANREASNTTNQKVGSR